MERGLTFACQTAAAKAEVVHYRPCCCVGDRLRLHQSHRQGVGEMKKEKVGGEEGSEFFGEKGKGRGKRVFFS